ncbi:MAG TPA: serine/threonine-protein kinase, partial [Herpetosiphonaceae bacterium]
MSLAPHTILQSRYEIIRVVGQGGLGAVYEAVDQRLQARVAIKQLIDRGIGGAEAFEREARLLSKLRHANLPRVSDHFSEAAGQFLVMDFVEGPDLGEVLDRRGAPLEIRQALDALDQLLGVLEYLHGHAPPIVHRDIKPANIKLSAGGELMLLDFGLAKGHSATQNLSVMGYTPHYAPLEQMQSGGTDVRSDLYAVAATAYHLLAGQPPADALTRAAASVRGRPDPLVDPSDVNPAIPRSLDAAITRNLSQDPDRRHPSARALRQTLRAIRPPAAA